MMKKLRLLILALLCGIAPAWSFAQELAPGWVWQRQGDTPDLLAVLLNAYSPADWSTHPHPAMARLGAGNLEGASASCQTCLSTVVDSLADAEARTCVVAAGYVALANGQTDAAIGHFRRARRMGADPVKMRLLHLTARYFETYGTQPPVFLHFNGGYMNFVSDSMQWKEPLTGAQMDQTLLILIELSELDPARRGLYLELMGDVCAYSSDIFRMNYGAAFAYLAAASQGAPASFERKALFALEAPRTNENNFNQYRFTQLKKAFKADLEQLRPGAAVPVGGLSSAQAAPIAFPAKVTDSETSEIMAKLVSHYDANAPKEGKFADQNELRKEVKRDTTFNMYALLIIGFILVAFLFFWYQYRKASKAQ